MLDIVKILYRELHYRRLKNNPQIAADPKKFKAQLRKTGDIKRGMAFQSIVFLFFGLMMAGAVVGAEDDTRAAVLFATYALLPFVMALYTTTVNTSYAVSMGIFEPLKPLPIKTGARYLSLLLAVDNVPAVVALIPASLAMIYRAPLSGLVGFLWVLMGAFVGHVLGLLVFILFGSSSLGGRFSRLRALARVVGVLLFIGMFYALNYVQTYVNEHYEEILPFFSKYSMAYPFSVVSILEPLRSFVLLLGYTVVFVPLYSAAIGRVWNRLEEGGTVSSVKEVRFRARTHHPVVEIALKDLRIVLRKSALLVGLVFPLFIILPSAIGVLTSGRVGEWSVASVLFMIAWMASVGIDTVLKIDGREFEFLRSLPITLGQFLRAKLLVMNVVPVTAGVLLVIIAAYIDSGFLKLIPAAILLPFLTSSIALTFFYAGERELSVPETNFGLVLVLIILNGIALGTVAGVWYFFGYTQALVVAGAGIAVILGFLNR
jgi:predicted permease